LQLLARLPMRWLRKRNEKNRRDMISDTVTDQDALEQVAAARGRLLAELGKVVIGQHEVIEQILITLLARGHALLMGVPGLGKTLLVKSIAQMLSLNYKRIQFTPDLMPADIFGTEVIEEDQSSGKRRFRFVKGPVFTNLLLADEINRTPPKTQAALLEAMAEQHVTVGGETYALPPPFFVLATQNPIELEGTYPLPEAQLDRFLLNVVMTYLPSADEERMVAATTSASQPQLQPVLDAAEVLSLQKLVREVPAPTNVISYAVRLVSATRPDHPQASATIARQVKWGAGSRASQALILAGKARALLQGRCNVACEDVRALAAPVLRHRIITTFHADAEGISSDHIIAGLLAQVGE